jgi:ABC-type transport system involved in multi-copper enzyme maturation permease subunit
MSGFLNDYMENMPESLRGWLGELQGPVTIEQWLGMEFLNMLIPVALPFLVMAIGARTVAGSEERKGLDLQLSNPLHRWQVIVGAVGTMAISLAAVLAVTWGLTYVAVPIAGVDLEPGRLAAALVALWPFCLLFGTFSLLLASVVRRAFLATVIPAVVLVAMYLVQAMAQVSETIRPARVLSLFYHLGKPVEGDFGLLAVLLMLAGALVLAAGAVVAFSKRDVYT